VAWPTAAGCACGKPECPSPAKHPYSKLAPHGLKDATTDEARIREIWTEAPLANIGINCEAAGLVVLDKDVRHGGNASLEQLEAITGPLETANVFTGSDDGSQHFIFQANGTPILSRPLDTDRYPGLDVKACGGYIVAAGSDHISGGHYSWGTSSAPQPIPAALLAVLPKKDSAPKEPRVGDGTRSGTIPEGQRNSALTSRAGQLRRIGLSEAGIAAALLQENVERCIPTPLPEAEVRSIAHSIGQKAPDDTIRAEAPRHVEAFDDVAILSRPEPDYLIAERIVERSHGMIYGPSGAGKSFVFIGVGLAIAGIRPWLGADVVKPGPVFYVLTEAAKVKARIRAGKLAAGLPLDQAVGFYTYPGVVNLSDADSVIRFVETVTPYHPRLIVIDTLSRCMSGDENNKADTAIVVAHSDYIREHTEAAIWWVHHSNASESRERGSTNLRASCDTVFALAKTDDLLTLTCEKQRDGEPFEPLRLRLVPVLDSGSCAIRLADDMTPITAATTGPLTATQAQALMVLQDIGGADGLTAGSWEAASPSIRHASLFRAIKVLIQRGVIRQNGQRYVAVRGVS
jgi:hypothetical protein